MKPKYNIGDKVTIKSLSCAKLLIEEECIKKYGLSFVSEMYKYCDKTVTICRIEEADKYILWYFLKGVDFTWVEDFFVEKFIDNIYSEE
jgi:hypothetical protein